MTDALDAEIAALEAEGAHRYDPVRFRYIKSLAARARGKPEKIAAFVRQKALAAIDAFLADFETARSEAKEVAGRIRDSSPDATQTVCELLKNNEFRKIHRLRRKLDRNRVPGPLSLLSRRIGRSRRPLEDNEARICLDDLLLRQEREVVSSFAGSAAQRHSAKDDRTADLRSLQMFKNTMMALNSNRMLTRAMKERPENPGPLNAQMLATRTLIALRQLSPEYLARFVSYIDTLLWMQKTDTGPEKRKI